MKKCIFLIVAAVFALFLSGCSGKNSYENSFSDEVLLSRGYPQTVLDSLSVSVKKSLQADDSLTFSCALITVYDSENEKYSEYYVNGYETVFMRDSDGDLFLGWVISETSDGEIIDVKFSYEWHEIPLLRAEDHITVSWNSEIYELVTNSFFKTDMYGNSEEYFVNSSESGYAQGGSGEVSWYADLSGSGSELFGYGEFKLHRRTSETEKSVLYGLYSHGNGSDFEEYASQIEY